jgi:nicotinate-nucleotide adenylyltransferase
MKVGLFFGSFNPIHNGHLIIAEHMATQTDLEQVWMVVSPHNPLKQKKTLANDYDRLHLAHLGINDNPRLKVSNIEFSLPKPSFTIDTLVHLKEKFSEHQFALIMGGDNLCGLHQWKNYETILNNYPIYVYRRPDFPATEFDSHPGVKFANAPLLDISSTYIRDCLRKNLSVRYLVPDEVYQYLMSGVLYRN